MLDCVVVSVEYRLAPEYPYPAAHEDAADAVLFAASPEGESTLRGPLKFLVGESAGGYLATWAAISLRRAAISSQIRALIVSYPIYDLALTPSCRIHNRQAVLSSEGMGRFIDVAFPNLSAEELRNPDMSLLYADLQNLPPALFLCGTEDPLVDDSAFMSARWSFAGNNAELCLIKGAWHAFTLMPFGEITEEGLREVVDFARKHS
jgi:acetyl esterase